VKSVSILILVKALTHNSLNSRRICFVLILNKKWSFAKSLMLTLCCGALWLKRWNPWKALKWVLRVVKSKLFSVSCQILDILSTWRLFSLTLVIKNISFSRKLKSQFKASRSFTWTSQEKLITKKKKRFWERFKFIAWRLETKTITLLLKNESKCLSELTFRFVWFPGEIAFFSFKK